MLELRYCVFFLGWFLAFCKRDKLIINVGGSWILLNKAPDGLPVSIIIPARNEERGIGACVLSALTQDHPNIEVIVLNDGSTDRTGEILEEIQQQNKRLKLPESDGESLPEDGSITVGTSASQRYATGRWLLFVDADVVLLLKPFPELWSMLDRTNWIWLPVSVL